MKLTGIVILAIAIISLSGCDTAPLAVSPSSTEAPTHIVGIDISKYQGAVDFNSVKAAGIRYVFIRATEGNTYQDPNFKSNISSARAAALTVSAYHFYETNDAPETQLENFTKLVSLERGDLPPVIDIEKLHNQDQSNLAENLKVFLNGLESHYGVKPIIYSGKKFANEYLTELGEYALWLAEYNVEEPSVPSGWDDWTFWQWSQSSTVKGIEGAVDADRFNGDESRFQSLLIR